MNKIRVKKVYVFFIVMLAFMIHFPVAFSHTKTFQFQKTSYPAAAEISAEESSLNKLYDSLQLNLSGLSQSAFNYAVKGYQFLRTKGKIKNENVLSIVDFTKPSSEKRLFILDLKKCKVLFNTYVSHGQKSGQKMATSFSNIPESYQSSLGFYTTSDTYSGKNGFSLHLKGMENGINDKAEERAIVMHGAPYVSENFIQCRGFLGRSWGCPAVPEQLTKPIIETIKNGSCLFIFSENAKYLRTSGIINS